MASWKSGFDSPAPRSRATAIRWVHARRIVAGEGCFLSRRAKRFVADDSDRAVRQRRDGKPIGDCFERLLVPCSRKPTAPAPTIPFADATYRELVPSRRAAINSFREHSDNRTSVRAVRVVLTKWIVLGMAPEHRRARADVLLAWLRTARSRAAACADRTTTVQPAGDTRRVCRRVRRRRGDVRLAAAASRSPSGSEPLTRRRASFSPTWFGAGRVSLSPRRQPHYDDEVTFRVDRLSDLIDVVVPFMDEHLPPSYKREQYEAWRAELLDYWEHDSKRRRPCTVDGCEQLRRAKGLCRHHYFVAYRR